MGHLDGYRIFARAHYAIEGAIDRHRMDFDDDLAGASFWFATSSRRMTSGAPNSLMTMAFILMCSGGFTKESFTAKARRARSFGILNLSCPRAFEVNDYSNPTA
jgi:hypothetical protein